MKAGKISICLESGESESPKLKTKEEKGESCPHLSAKEGTMQTNMA